MTLKTGWVMHAVSYMKGQAAIEGLPGGATCTCNCNLISVGLHFRKHYLCHCLQ